MCTRDRPRELPRAVASVLADCTEDVEIIVVDDGVGAIAILDNADDRIRLIRTGGLGVGAARAAGLDAARGDYLAFCDDDDEWLPGHLATLTTFLDEHSDVDLAYGDAEWTGDGQPPAVPYSIDFDLSLLGEVNYVHPSDLVVRADAARAVGGFDRTLRSFEDWDLWLRMSRTSRMWHVPVVVTRRHWLDASIFAEPDWTPFERIRDDHRRRVARAIVPFDRDTWSNGRRMLLWRSVFRTWEGFGSAGRALLVATADEDIDITVVPEGNQPPAGFEAFHGPVENWGSLAFHYLYAEPVHELACDRVVVYTMFESTKVPADRVAELNTSAAVVCVPCQQNTEAYRESGLRVPIAVLPHGVDRQRFPFVERSSRSTFTFGTFGDLMYRKGCDVLLKAFVDEFRTEDDVRLIFKSVRPIDVVHSEDPRVSIVTSRVEDGELLEFLSTLDAFVLPSRGEGFGLCGLEAMATGLPVIATGWSGPADYLDPADSLALSYRLVPVNGVQIHGTRYFGRWAEPDVEHLRALMRWLYEHRAEGAEMGRRASHRVHTQWTWQHAARRLIELLDTVAAE